MNRRHLAGVLFALSATSAVAGQQQPPQQPPTFRTGITVVPVDVRVLDRSGRPITDLKQSDFTIREDGVPQRIVHFSVLTLQPSTEVSETLDLRRPLGETVTPQNRRIFLIVLGRGRQTGPVKAVEAATQFVKDRLLPQDQVAVLAYNRATAFTADHPKVVETLERYRKKHESIEAKMKQHFSGLAAAYGSDEIPPFIQAEIDGIFRVPGALVSRHVDATGATDAGRIAADTRRERELVQTAEIAAARRDAGVATPFDEAALAEAERAGVMDVSFDEYVEKALNTRTDLSNLYAGVRYLRLIDGEKHLVFITPKGMYLPRLENSNSLAAMANDARVTVDIIHTYGAEAWPMRLSAPAGMRGVPPPPPMNFGPIFQIGSSRQVAVLTGGQMTTARTGDDFFKNLDQSTRAQYFLGYSPENFIADGKYRRIEVKVNRPGAQVLYRHGYLARRETAPMDRQRFLTYTRIASAANASRDIDDVKVTLGTPAIEMVNGTQALSVTAHVSHGAIDVKLVDGSYVGKLEAVWFCGDGKERVVGEMWQTIDLKMPEEIYQRFKRDGLTFNVRIPLTGEPRFMKAILYDYGTDLVGSARVDVRGKR